MTDSSPKSSLSLHSLDGAPLSERTADRPPKSFLDRCFESGDAVPVPDEKTSSSLKGFGPNTRSPTGGAVTGEKTGSSFQGFGPYFHRSSSTGDAAATGEKATDVNSNFISSRRRYVGDAQYKGPYHTEKMSKYEGLSIGPGEERRLQSMQYRLNSNHKLSLNDRFAPLEYGLYVTSERAEKNEPALRRRVRVVQYVDPHAICDGGNNKGDRRLAPAQMASSTMRDRSFMQMIGGALGFGSSVTE